ETNAEPNGTQVSTPFTDKLKKIKQMLETDANGRHKYYSPDYIADTLGNHVSALKSVPSAIYCALRAQHLIDGFESDNPFVRTIYFAISLGGDTDTIASLAGSVAGNSYDIFILLLKFWH